MYKIKFPREVCNPRRHTVASEDEFLDFVNSNISCTDIFTNVYNFSEFIPPFMYPVYDSAIIDRIYFDCDQKVREGSTYVMLPAYENMLKIHEWCVSRDIMHIARCTGTAYDVVIFTDPEFKPKNKKECVANAQMWLSKHLGITIDPQIIGDIARIHRVDNTFNHKDTAKRFVTQLDKNLIYAGEKKIFEEVKKQTFRQEIFGDKYWDISQFDTPEKMYSSAPTINIEIDESELSDIADNLPPCIKKLLSIESLGFQERRLVILALRDNCYTLQETINILKNHLSKNKFLHCTRDERQPQYLYKKGKYLFPHKSEIADVGACDLPEGEYCNMAEHGCLLYRRDR